MVVDTHFQLTDSIVHEVEAREELLELLLAVLTGDFFYLLLYSLSIKIAYEDVTFVFNNTLKQQMH